MEESDNKHDNADANPNAPSTNGSSFAALDQLTSTQKQTL
jgi:hypothetical protein